MPVLYRSDVLLSCRYWTNTNPNAFFRNYTMFYNVLRLVLSVVIFHIWFTNGIWWLKHIDFIGAGKRVQLKSLHPFTEHHFLHIEDKYCKKISNKIFLFFLLSPVPPPPPDSFKMNVQSSMSIRQIDLHPIVSKTLERKISKHSRNRFKRNHYIIDIFSIYDWARS